MIACGWMVSNWAFCEHMEIPELKAAIDRSVGYGIPQTIIAAAKLEAAANVREMRHMQRRNHQPPQSIRAPSQQHPRASHRSALSQEPAQTFIINPALAVVPARNVNVALPQQPVAQPVQAPPALFINANPEAGQIPNPISSYAVAGQLSNQQLLDMFAQVTTMT